MKKSVKKKKRYWKLWVTIVSLLIIAGTFWVNSLTENIPHLNEKIGITFIWSMVVSGLCMVIAILLPMEDYKDVIRYEDEEEG